MKLLDIKIADPIVIKYSNSVIAFDRQKVVVY